MLCPVRLLFPSKPCRIMILLLSLFTIFLFYTDWDISGEKVTTTTTTTTAVTTTNESSSWAHKVLLDLCNAYTEKQISGDLCNRLCYRKNWKILEINQDNKIVIKIQDGGQEVILKSQNASINDFDQLDPHVAENDFFDAVLGIVNCNLKLGWPAHYKRHLIEILWPKYVRKGHDPLSHADRRSLWALLSQDEYITFRVLPLTRVTPKVVGTCGHFYQVETLATFRLKSNYMHLKSKILMHLMGTLKLFDEFLNEPLQWCDVKFENLGLADDYPKRFMVMDADMLYTKSRLKAILNTRRCVQDKDCYFFDCHAKCNNDTGFCTDRTNNNLEVFCEKLISQLYGTFWTKSNDYLVACHDKSLTVDQRMTNLRSVWSVKLSDV